MIEPHTAFFRYLWGLLLRHPLWEAAACGDGVQIAGAVENADDHDFLSGGLIIGSVRAMV